MRVLNAEGDRFPEARRVVSEALGGAGAGRWNADPQTLVAVAAISGYHQLSQLPHGPFEGVEDTAFLGMLVAYARPGAAVDGNRWRQRR